MQEHPKERAESIAMARNTPQTSKQPCTPDFVSCEQFGSEVHLLHAALLHERTKLWARAFPVGLRPRKAPGMQRARFMG